MSYRWHGHYMCVVEAPERHRRVHLATEVGRETLCERYRGEAVTEKGEVATGWPDCNDCVALARTPA